MYCKGAIRPVKAASLFQTKDESNKNHLGRFPNKSNCSQTLQLQVPLGGANKSLSSTPCSGILSCDAISSTRINPCRTSILRMDVTSSPSLAVATAMPTGDPKIAMKIPFEKESPLQNQLNQEKSQSNYWWWHQMYFMFCVVALLHFLIVRYTDVGVNRVHNESNSIQHHGNYTRGSSYHQKFQHYAQQSESLTKVMQSNYAYAELLQKQLDNKRQEIIHTIQEIQQTLNKVNNEKNETSIMQHKIQKFSRKLLLAKYGPGPHYVEIQLGFHPNSNVYWGYNDINSNRIVVQLASIDLMPHTVYFFLEQVSNRLYDGFSFHINAKHVIQAGASPNFMNNPSENSDLIYRRFQESGLQNVLVQEYSPEYPHLPYTLGYAGKPNGGPDFYISMMDNTDFHGPSSTALSNNEGPNNNINKDGEPCFAKVVSGSNAVDRMYKSATTTQNDFQQSSSATMKHNVAIRSMRIIPSS